ncbi:unnamed protein product [Coffea canephora]|uniref:F-box domain-containing protein n=2 Tax=Coffea TaxID=13442 RepID=A0A068V6D6_COFCA|nr:F-box protein At5g07610-like [Coffea arabica]CDP16132.1 unnamed protein product [Coffea canephora]
MDPHRRGRGGTSRGSSAAEFAIKHYANPRRISLLSSPTTSSASAEPLLLVEKDDENQIPKAPRLHSSSWSADFVTHNEDLLAQILLFLPPKSLLRFQSVSKQWLSIISSPGFRRMHSRKYRSAGSSFFVLDSCVDDPPLNFISLRQEDVKLMGTITSGLNDFLDGGLVLNMHSCNGLLCIDVSFELTFFNEDRRLLVYNPTTDEYRTIPREKSAQDQSEGVNIVFDPSKSHHYILVSALVVNEDEDEFRFTVYSSETGLWSETAAKFEHDGDRYYFEKGAYWNGDLHWVSVSSGTLCFDLDNKRLRPVIPHPSTPSVEWRDICYFGESGGDLYLIGLDKPQAMLWKVYSLKRDYSGWVVKYSIDVASLVTFYPSMVVEEESNEKHFDLHMPCFVVDEKEKKAMPVILLRCKVISYDISDMTVEELAEIDSSHLEHAFSFRAPKYCLVDAVQHTETLACI